MLLADEASKNEDDQVFVVDFTLFLPYIRRGSMRGVNNVSGIQIMY